MQKENGVNKAVLFDFDGTLVDSVREVYRGVCNVFKQSKVPVPTFTEFINTYEAPYQKYYRDLGIVASDEQAVEWYLDVVRRDKQPFFPDVKDSLLELHERGYILGIISANFEVEVKNRCDEFGISHFFEVVVGRASDKVKPLRDFCSTYDVIPYNVCYLGDFASDVRDGREAGVVSVGITRGNETKEMLFRHGADFCVEHLPEFMKILG